MGKLGGSRSEEVWLVPKLRVRKLSRFVTGIKDLLVIPVRFKTSCLRDCRPVYAVSDRNMSKLPVSTITFSCLLL